MILDRSHRQWLLVTGILFGLGAVSYAWYASGPAGASGGSLPGLMFGIVGTAMMIFAGLLSARRQVPTWRIGSAQFWLKGHIWLGLLSVAFILFHSGFRWGGPVEIGLWLATAVIILSGIVGLAFQQVLPRLLTTRVPRETFIDQLPYLCASMQFLADKIVSESSGKLDINAEAALGAAEDVARQRKWLKRESDLQKIVSAIYENASQLRPEESAPAKPKPAAKTPGKPSALLAAQVVSEPVAAPRAVIRTEELKSFYLKTVRPFLAISSRGDSPLAQSDRRRAAFGQMRVDLPSELQDVLEQLEQFCDERSQLHRLRTIHRWLHGWLFLHVPVSASLLVLFIVHVVISLRVVPWEWSWE
ncbi:MAG: hypothetical protein VX311_08280 [Planctomycetota bacterium]|nr:hypothetical protein [Planctomycetota bacterium]MEE3284566.1 hypothetical protein [Planctomycetota bacterium]HCD02662.1 hypothetical protein [Planctomycetaceae bacterium]